jgi:hypothetical protein
MRRDRSLEVTLFFVSLRMDTNVWSTRLRKRDVINGFSNGLNECTASHITRLQDLIVHDVQPGAVTEFCYERRCNVEPL